MPVRVSTRRRIIARRQVAPLVLSAVVEFEETQQLRQWGLWAPLLALVAGWGVLAWQQLGPGHPVGTRPLAAAGLWLTGGLLLALVACLYTLALTTRVGPDGLWVRYAPLVDVHLRWDQLARAEAVRYGFVGYGIRFSAAYGTIYNAHGHWGLLLHQKSGEKLLIGTQQPEAFARAVAAFLPAPLLPVEPVRLA